MSNEITALILSYEDINKCANVFLIKHKRNSKLPIDIEVIAEFDLGLNIFPFPHLQKMFDVEGFLSGDLTTIYVDEFIYYERPTRYRFSIAHEIGHYVLHSDLMINIHPQNVSDWKGFVLGIDDDTYGWLEYQAYTFAAAVLMPRSELQEHFAHETKLLQPKIDVIKAKGLSIENSQDYIVNAIATNLVGVFDVSSDALTKRISNEIQRGHMSLNNHKEFNI
jgi:Zn-dependent peptidase ImmA (M78 family)